MTSGGVAVGFEMIIYAAIAPPTMKMASTLNLRMVHFQELDLVTLFTIAAIKLFPASARTGGFLPDI